MQPNEKTIPIIAAFGVGFYLGQKAATWMWIAGAGLGLLYLFGGKLPAGLPSMPSFFPTLTPTPEPKPAPRRMEF